MAAIAEEYSRIPESIEQALDSIEGFIQTLQSSFADGELPEADAVVDQYHQLESELESFNDEINNLLSYLRGESEPESVDDITQIETASRALMESAETFRDRCQALSDKFSELGLSEQAEAMTDLAGVFDEIPSEIANSLLDNQLLFALKTEHFPGAVKGSIPELTNKLTADDPEQRQNAAFMLARLAADFPAAVGEYHEQLTTRLPEAPVKEQQNLLAALLYVSEADSMPDTIARTELLELIHADDTNVALYAALVLGTQSTTATQAELITARVMSLLDVDADTDTKVNATMVLYQLAESHPDAVTEFVPEIVPLLDDSASQVKENVIELLGVLDRGAYRADIRSIRNATDDTSLAETATTVLEGLPTEDSNEPERESAGSADTTDTDSILSEIEDEFEME